MSNIKYVFVLSLVFIVAVSCTEMSEPEAKEEINQNILARGFDTLCVYPLYSGQSGQYAFQDSAQLFSFLDNTGFYMEVGGATNKFKRQLDFKKWSYFAFAGGMPTPIRNISYDGDTVIITIIGYHEPKCDNPPCPAYTSPPDLVFVYFIPFTNKEIKFVDVIEE